jgi:hypothetical protein
MKFQRSTVCNCGVLLALGISLNTCYAATYSNQRVTTAAPPATSCTVPPVVTSFLTTDNTVYLYFEAVVSSANDSLSNDWVAPDGSVAQGGYWAPADGDFCFTGASLSITKTPSNLLGNWQARVWDGNTILFSVPFTISAPARATPTSSALSVTNQQTVAALVTGTNGNTNYCASPLPRRAFQTTDASVGVWFTFNHGHSGDILQVNWIHPSGAVDAYQPGVTLNYTGSGCYAWFLGINGAQPASDPGGWQVSLLVNGSPAFTLPFFVGPVSPMGPVSITSVSTNSPIPLTALYLKTTGLNTAGPVSVTFSDNSGYSVTQPAIRVSSDGTVVASVPIYSDANGKTSSGKLSLNIAQGNTTSPPMTVNVQNLPSVQSYGMNPGDISRAFLNYEAMGIAQRLNELQAFGALPGSQVDVSSEVTKLKTVLKGVIQARSDVDRVAANNSTVIDGGSLQDGTPVRFDRTSLDMMDRVYAVYLTQLEPYVAAPPPNLGRAFGTKFVNRSPIAGVSGGTVVRARFVLGYQHRPRERADHPRLSNPFSTLKSFTDYLTTATNLSGLAATYQAYAASGKAPPDGGSPDRNFLDTFAAATGGISGVLGLYGQTLSGAKALPVNTASALFGALSGGASMLNDLGHELGALAFVATAGDNTDPQVINDAWDEVISKDKHLVVDAVQTEAALFSYGINSADMPLFSAALDKYGLEFAAAMQTSFEEGSGNTGLQAAALVANVGAYYLDGGFDSLANLGNAFCDEASNGAIGIANAFGEVTGSITLGGALGLYAPLAGLDITSDYYRDDFGGVADPNGNYLVYLPLNDSNFDYSNADVMVMDPESGAQLGSVTVNLNDLASGPVQAGNIKASCSDDDAGNPDDDDPDCDNSFLILPGRDWTIIVATAVDTPVFHIPIVSTQYGDPDRLRV